MIESCFKKMALLIRYYKINTNLKFENKKGCLINMLDQPSHLKTTFHPQKLKKLTA